MSLFQNAKRVQELESLSAEQAKAISALETELSDAAKLNAELSAKLQTIEASLATITGERDAFKAKIDEANQRAEAAEADKRKLASEAASIVAGKTVDPVKEAPGAAAAADNPMEILNACKPSERAAKYAELKKAGAIAAAFKKI